MEILLAKDEDVKEGETKEIDFAGRPAILIRKDGKVYAYVNCCTHVGGPVKLEGALLRCQWHNSHFEPETGKTLSAPAPLDSKLIGLPIQIKGGNIYYIYP